jgi:hypothetical protein
MNFFKSKVLILLFWLISLNNAQDVSQDFLINSYFNMLRNHQNSWQANTSLKPILWDDISLKKIDSTYNIPKWVFSDFEKLVESSFFLESEKNLNVSGWFGNGFQSSVGDTLDFDGSASTLYYYFNYSYKKAFKAWIYARITTNGNSLAHYTGKPRKQRRLGFNSGETDMSGFGYFKPWIQVWYGRGRQNWGILQNDNISLSSNSPSYDQLTLQLKYKKLKYKYFHGYLETIGNNNHRYIVGKGLEYNNLKNFLISLSEIVLYSGVNRPLDLSYANLLNTHLEIELNGRDNRIGGTGGSNAIWNISTDFAFSEYYRLSINLLIDELGLDDYNITETDTTESINNFGYQIRLSSSKNILNLSSIFYLYFSRISAYALRHENYANNFVSRNLVLGSELGSDSQVLKAGFEVIASRRTIFKIALGIQQSGQNNLINNLYNSYSNISPINFPSGAVDNHKFINASTRLHLKYNLDIELDYQYIASKQNFNNINISLNYQMPFRFSL